LDADEELLRQLGPSVGGRVQFLGQVSEADKWWLLAHADAVLYPSIVEGFGLVPFEAAAVDTPCLTYGGTAPGEVLSSTDAIIGTWDPSAWADRVKRWIDDESARSGVIAEVRRVADSYSWRQCAELTWAAIDATLAQPTRADEVDEGGLISRVAGMSSLGRHSATARFTLARAIPALRRRVTYLAERRKRQTT
jgi:glycosyltransferase involved in cell wall biosynthesis